ncbi:MAG: hypothetical protein II771_06140, partial [Clostridia bacterium]|nr:hypothetical protein [Clostridia bacterium]
RSILLFLSGRSCRTSSPVPVYQRSKTVSRAQAGGEPPRKIKTDLVLSHIKTFQKAKRIHLFGKFTKNSQFDAKAGAQAARNAECPSEHSAERAGHFFAKRRPTLKKQGVSRRPPAYG